MAACAPRRERRGAARRAAMERAEPAMIDLWGATLDGPGAYRLAPGARRYEFYEKSFASIVRALPRAPPPSCPRAPSAQPDCVFVRNGHVCCPCSCAGLHESGSAPPSR